MSASHAVPLFIPPSTVFAALNAVEIGRHSIIAAYTILFYDWIISFDDEMSLIYPASWNSVKIAYYFCRYFPLLVSPFHIWGLVTNHDRSTCHTYFRALYTCAMPTVLSAHFILMLRSYAFSGRKRLVLVVLSAFFSTLVGVVLWVMSVQLHLSNIFIITTQSGCFASTNAKPVPSPHIGAYQLGLISVLAALFDCINMLMVIRHCIRERSTLGPLGQSFLKQGTLDPLASSRTQSANVYFHRSFRIRHNDGHEWLDHRNIFHPTSVDAGYRFLVCLQRTLRPGNSLSPSQRSTLSDESLLVMQAVSPSLIFIRDLEIYDSTSVLLLRRKVCPTETELDDKYSNMINEAIEMIPAGSHPEDTIISSIRFERVDSQA
ncbi:hypothetical protein BGW80DRAFT_1556904 [Lactifluus volemus]|nr:hypothetical protein BGW80DRAFT_1556904 [Lactifluus volemus]